MERFGANLSYGKIYIIFFMEKPTIFLPFDYFSVKIIIFYSELELFLQETHFYGWRGGVIVF